MSFLEEVNEPLEDPLLFSTSSFEFLIISDSSSDNYDDDDTDYSSLSDFEELDCSTNENLKINLLSGSDKNQDVDEDDDSKNEYFINPYLNTQESIIQQQNNIIYLDHPSVQSHYTSSSSRSSNPPSLSSSTHSSSSSSNNNNNNSNDFGDTWYVVSFNWFREWLLCVESPDANNNHFSLGPIDNSQLVLLNNNTNNNNNEENIEQESFNIKPGLIENHHYILVCEKVWKSLYEKYGGFPVLGRKVVKNYFTKESVDLRIPLTLQLVRSSNQSDIKTIYVQKNETILNIKERGCSLYNLSKSNIRVWDYYNYHKHCELKDSDIISNSNLLEKQYILLEERLIDGTWPPLRDR
eukprot:gene602-750_t